jgi:hypothetical protein
MAGEVCIMRSFINCTLHQMWLVIKSKRMRWTRHVARMGRMRNVYKILVGKPEGKRLVGRPRRSREVNIGMDLDASGPG